MNRFTKLILTSAIISTSGFAATDSYVAGNFVVNGTVNQNKDADVTGLISVNENGVFNNKATLSFKSDGGLAISVQRSSTLADYQDANATYSLGVPPIGQYLAGSIIAVFDDKDNLDIARVMGVDDLDFSKWDTNRGKYTEDGKDIIAKNKVAFESVPENLPQKGYYYSISPQPCSGHIEWTFDSSLDTYAAGEISGKIMLRHDSISDDPSQILDRVDQTADLNRENWEYERQCTDLDGEVAIVKNKIELSKADVEHLPDTINWTYEKNERLEVDLEWRSTPQSEESFIAQVKSAIEGSSAPEEIKTQLKNGDVPGGTFDNNSGKLNLVEASGDQFSGSIQGGTVMLKDTTAATLTGLQVSDVTAEYEYASEERFGAPTVSEEKYIKVQHDAGKTTDEAKQECLDKFATESTITTFNGIPYGDANTDERLTFPEILTDITLNSSENKLKTSEMQMIVKDYNAAAGLSVDETVNIQFEGSDALKFATGKTVDSDQVIEFAGSQNAFTGNASFAEGITRVVASGDNALPVNLASDMSAINLEISGENKINNSGYTAIKNLKVNPGATLTVVAGTTLNIGSNE